MGITRFVARGTTYTFPTSPGEQDYRTNFAELVPATVRMPGASGGYDGYGDGRAPSAIGNVQFSYYLVSDTRAGMTALRDAAATMADRGVGRLYQTMTDGTERWCWARVNNITMSERRHMHSDLFQLVQVSMQVSDPFWYGVGNSVVWGGGATWGGGTKWGGGAPVSASGLKTTTTITNGGNAFTYLQAAVRPGAGQVANDVIIRRVRDGVVEDEVRYFGTVSAGSNLVMDSRRRAVRLDGVGVYGTQFSAGAEWLRLLPGANTIEIKFAQASDAASVNLRYLERWV